MPRGQYFIAVLAFAGCSRIVDKFTACSTAGTACVCGNQLHGLTACVASGAICSCVAPVTPTISIDGAPAALLVGQTYNASLANVEGLIYDWTILGGTFNSKTRADSVTFTPTAVGALLLTVNVTNSGGDSAAPAVLPISVVEPLATLADTDFVAPPLLTTNRAGVPLSVVAPIAGLTYVWSIDAASPPGANVDASGAAVHLKTGAPGILIVDVYAQNSVGQATNTIAKTINVVAQQIEIVAGTPGGPGHLDASGTAARFGGDMSGVPNAVGSETIQMTLAADSLGNVFVGDVAHQVVRRIAPDKSVTTIAGAPDLSGLSAGVGAAARFRFPVIGLFPSTPNTLIVGNWADATFGSTESPSVVVLSDLSAAFATATSISPTGPSGAALFNQVTAIGTWTDNTVILSDGCTVYQFTLTGTTTSASTKQANYPSSSVIVNAVVDGATDVIYSTGAGIHDFYGTGDVETYPNQDVAETDQDTAPVVGMTGDGTNIYFAQRDGQIFEHIVTHNAIWGPASAPTLLGGRLGLVAKDGPSPLFVAPGALAASPNGDTLYIVDGTAVRAMDLVDADHPVTTIAGVNATAVDADSIAGAASSFSTLSGISIGADDTIYVAESSLVANEPSLLKKTPFSGSICKLKSISPAGAVTTLTGGGCGTALDGTAGGAALGLPWGMLAQSDGSLLFTDGVNGSLRSLTTDSLILSLAAFDGVPTSLAIGPSGLIAVGLLNLANPGAGDLYGYIALVDDGHVLPLAFSPNCGSDAGKFGQDDGHGCMGPVAAVAFDAAGGFYALAEFNQGTATAPNVTPEIYYFASPAFSPSKIAGGTAACAPQASEPCETACIRTPVALQIRQDAPFIAAAAVDPVSQDLFFTDGELVRRIDHSSGTCRVNIVAGVAGDMAIVPGDLASARLNNLSGLAFSPVTRDLYATDLNENVIVRIRY